uniref:TSA: Wollemia nobilis Ref_Wollemi_Transcript_11386_2630 transcribed RNA sequence n=1 Tax=Wollemia nobilis TaxID=56998 RepID=A0A0C9QSQ0_9CONI
MVRIFEKAVVCWLLLVVVSQGSVFADPNESGGVKQQVAQTEASNHIVTEPTFGGSRTEAAAGENGVLQEGNKKDAGSRVAVSTVAWLTLAMAAATGLGAVPFFFVDLDAEWAGICNGIAAGVMLAASFDLVQEGQKYGGGSWVVFGILAGGIFILLCQKYLERYGEVSMLDIKGADARKMVLVVGIMTLHSFGEGSGVGVSFAGYKGLSQGILVTIAIAVHNIPEGLAVSMVLASRGVSPRQAMMWSVITSLPQPLVAVPAYICAEAFHIFLPFCMGFAAGCMIWMVIAEVVPDSFKEASGSQVATAATLAVAFMETLSVVLDTVEQGQSWENMSGFLVSLLFGLGPFFGGFILVTFASSVKMQHSFLTGIASGIAIILAAWRPLQLWMGGKMGVFYAVSLLGGGAFLFHVISRVISAKFSQSRGAGSNNIQSTRSISPLALKAFLASGAVALHAFAEGLALGVAAPKAYGMGRHMMLPVSLHGLPRGAAVASCIYGATDSWRGALFAAAFTGFAGPIAAIGAILAGIDYSGLDTWMVFACGALLPAFGGSLLHRFYRLSSKHASYGLVMGMAFAFICLTSTRLVCLHTPYCNSAPEAVT